MLKIVFVCMVVAVFAIFSPAMAKGGAGAGVGGASAPGSYTGK